MKDSDIQIRPIGIGEILRHITGKCVTTVLRKDTQEAAGPLQYYRHAVEHHSAIHVARRAFEDDDAS